MRDVLRYTAFVTLDRDRCFRALQARDVRFDGHFFVAVRTTGVYCRPICPARIPRMDRCEFFARAAEAEREGYRACFRCRPELAPGAASVDAIPRLVRSALARLDAGALNEQSVDALAGELGVTARHLRRAMEAETGVSPIEYAQTRRLALAKQLLQETDLPVTDIAFASGFASVRRFHALFATRFGRSPTTVRRRVRESDRAGEITLRLDYRPPFDWTSLRAFLAARATAGVEHVGADSYARTFAIGEHRGWLSVAPHPTRAALSARIALPLAPKLARIVPRLRALFDLDANPSVLAEHLRRDPLLARSLRRAPGLRVPGAFDAFEVAVRAIIGQQISVAGASTLTARLAERFGAALDGAPPPLARLFPDASRLARTDIVALRSVGLTTARADTVRSFARAFADGRIPLESPVDPERLVQDLQSLPGIGAWTAHVIAMRACHWPDAFPALDLVVRTRLGVRSERDALARAEPWRPWRAYAVMHLWNESSGGRR